MPGSRLLAVLKAKREPRVAFGVRTKPTNVRPLKQGGSEAVAVEAFNVTASDFELGMQGNCCVELKWAESGSTWRPAAAFLPAADDPTFEPVFTQDVEFADPFPAGSTLPTRGAVRLTFWRTPQNPVGPAEELEPKAVVFRLEQ